MSSPIVAIGRRELNTVGGTDGRQHDVGVSSQRVVVADEVVANVARVAEIVLRSPVPVSVSRHVYRVDDVADELAERYAAALTCNVIHRNINLAFVHEHTQAQQLTTCQV